jgi:hypothetical protein
MGKRAKSRKPTPNVEHLTSSHVGVAAVMARVRANMMIDLAV